MDRITAFSVAAAQVAAAAAVFIHEAKPLLTQLF